MEKSELHGVVTLTLAVKTGDGILTKGQRVKLTDDLEVGVINAAYDDVFGYVLCANREDGGDATIVTNGKRVSSETTGEAYPVGSKLSVTSANKLQRAKAAAATASVTIVDYSLVDSVDTVTVNGVVLTAGGTDFTAATSNNATALSLADAINNKVPGVKASVAIGSAVVVISVIEAGVYGNSFTLATSMTSGEGTVSGATFTGGRDYSAFALALEESTGADQTKQILWF